MSVRQSVFPCVSDILFLSTPLKIFNSVICLIAVDVIYKRFVVRVREKGFCNQSMNSNKLTLICRPQLNSQIAIVIYLGGDSSVFSTINPLIRLALDFFLDMIVLPSLDPVNPSLWLRTLPNRKLAAERSLSDFRDRILLKRILYHAGRHICSSHGVVWLSALRLSAWRLSYSLPEHHPGVPGEPFQSR